MTELILMFIGGFCAGIVAVCVVGFIMLKKAGADIPIAQTQ